MTYAERIDQVIQTLRGIEHGVDGDYIEEHDTAVANLTEIMHELDTTPRAPDGGGLVLLASFPYTHPDDRDTRRLAIYDKPCPSGDGSGEFIIWSEVREQDHDGYREAARHNGLYTGYVGTEERNAAYYLTLDKFSYKCARIVGPFVPEKYRGYRRAN